MVAKENEGLLRDAWRADEEEKRKKEKAKREKIALGTWKKFLIGLRIVERVRREYGEGDGVEKEIQKAVHAKDKGKKKAATAKKAKSGANKHDAIDLDNSERDITSPHFGHDHDSDNGEEGGGFPNHDDIGGGFLLEGEDMEEIDHVAREGNFVLDHNPASRAVDDDGDVDMGPHRAQDVVKEDSDDEAGGFGPGGFEPETEDENPPITGGEHGKKIRKADARATKKSSRTESTPARKRGRPSAVSVTMNDNDNDDHATATTTPAPAKRPRKPRSSNASSAAKRAPAASLKRRKYMKNEDEDDNHDDEDADEHMTIGDSAVNGSASGKSKASVKKPTAAQRRNAGRKSKESARSKYFVEGSDLEDDDDEEGHGGAIAQGLGLGDDDEDDA